MENDYSGLPKSKQEAREKGEKYYFDGSICPNGHIAKRSADRGRCQECRRIHKQKDYQKHKEQIDARKTEWRKANPEKVKAQSKRTYLKNKDKINERAREKNKLPETKLKRKEYEELNKDKLKISRQKSYLKHREKRIKDATAYKTKRRKEDINERLKSNLRGRVSTALKLYKKSNSTMKLVGCSLEELKRHLESLFQTGMTWENYGAYTLENPNVWHIDHIIPCASFNLENPEEQKKCFHWSNLQPLWGPENNSKNDFLPDGTRARDKKKK